MIYPNISVIISDEMINVYILFLFDYLYHLSFYNKYQ